MAAVKSVFPEFQYECPLFFSPSILWMDVFLRCKKLLIKFHAFIACLLRQRFNHRTNPSLKVFVNRTVTRVDILLNWQFRLKHGHNSRKKRDGGNAVLLNIYLTNQLIPFIYESHLWPDRPFHNFLALKSADRRFRTTQILFISGFFKFMRLRKGRWGSVFASYFHIDPSFRMSARSVSIWAPSLISICSPR